MWQLLRTVGCVSHSQSSTAAPDGAHFGEHVADNATVVVLRNEQKLRPAQDVVQIVLRNGRESQCDFLVQPPLSDWQQA
jgi:hypothetical protein